MDMDRGWKSTGDGWGLYKPSRKSETYRVSEGGYRSIKAARSLETMAATVTIIPLVAIWLLWLKDFIGIAVPILSSTAYVVGNSWLSWRRWQTFRAVMARATIAPTKLELDPVPVKEMVKEISGQMARGHAAHVKSNLMFTPYVLLAYGGGSLILGAMNVATVFGFPVLSTLLACVVTLFGLLVLLGNLLVKNRR